MIPDFSIRHKRDPDERIDDSHFALDQDYRRLLAEIARLEAQWLLDDRIRFALRNERRA